MQRRSPIATTVPNHGLTEHMKQLLDRLYANAYSLLTSPGDTVKIVVPKWVYHDLWMYSDSKPQGIYWVRVLMGMGMDQAFCRITNDMTGKSVRCTALET